MERKESIRQLEETTQACKGIVVDKLREYVRMFGDDVTDYERSEFGLEDEDECHITKVLNLYDNGGCVVVSQRNLCPDVSIECGKDALLQQLSDNFDISAYQCLYIETDEYGRENLKYYVHYNTGVAFSSDFADSEHEYVMNLSMSEIGEIINIVTRLIP